MAMKAEEALAIAKSYTNKTLKGQGALKGEDGFSPVITENTNTGDVYKLDITTKDGKITTPNLVGKQGIQGEIGPQGKPADNPIVSENADNTDEIYKLDLTVGETVFTTRNIQGKQGLEGVSPSVTTNPDNTAEDYRLNITTKGGTFTTPNLRGPIGPQGEQGESAASAINPRGDYDVNADPHYTLSDYITSAEGNTYVCKKDNPNNVAPTDGTVNDEFWQILALRGAKGEAGKDGEKGADGVTFTPSIDENGILSFTNNGGLENPNPIDIKGDNGVTFTPSIDAEGYLSFTNNGNLENPEPIKVLGQDGADGKDGIDGTTYIPSIGTVTTVESNAEASAGVTVDEETKEAVFHFEFPKGEDGFSPIVETVESENGHTVNITDADGVKSFEVLNGKDGVQIDDKTSSITSTYSSAKIDEKIAKHALPLIYDTGIRGNTGIEIYKLSNVTYEALGGENAYNLNLILSTRAGEEIELFGGKNDAGWLLFARKHNDYSTKILDIHRDGYDVYVRLGTYFNYFRVFHKSGALRSDFAVSMVTSIPDTATEIPITAPGVMDNQTSTESTWSSSKIASELKCKKYEFLPNGTFSNTFKLSDISSSFDGRTSFKIKISGYNYDYDVENYYYSEHVICVAYPKRADGGGVTIQKIYEYHTGQFTEGFYKISVDTNNSTITISTGSLLTTAVNVTIEAV